MKIRQIVYNILPIILVMVLILPVCSDKESLKNVHNTLTKKEIEEGWELLFDGNTLNGWQYYLSNSWKAVDGTIALVNIAGFRYYIWTDKKYEDFILDLEYKVAPRGTGDRIGNDMGNSGIFFRTGDLLDPVQTGLEMQIQFPAERTNKKHTTGGLYDIVAPGSDAGKPGGEWNRAVITCKDNIVTVVLNDVQVVNMDLDEYTTPEMNIDGTKNKYEKALKDFPRKGYIGLQDHGWPVWFRNIKIKEL